jgi:hypothetical protein
VLSGAEASGTLNWPTAELTELTLPDTARVDAALRADFEKESWTAGFEADRWALPWLDGRKLNVAFSAEGDAERIDVRSLTAAVEELSLTASGGYVFEREKPISAELELTFARGLSAADADAEANGSDGGSGSGGATRWGGRGRWTGTVTGSLEPRSVEARGELRLDRLLVGRQTMEDVQFPMHATWTTRLLSVESEWFDLLEGRCSFAGTYNPVERDLRVTLDTEGVSLGRVATLANPNLRIEGAMDAEVNLSLPGLSQERMELSGDWEVRDFRADPVTVDQADGRFRTRGRMLRLEPIRLRKGEGRAEGRVVFNLRDGRTVRAELRGDDWPVHLDRPRLDAVADGRLHNMTVDVIDRQVQGDLDLSVDVDLRGESLGRVTVRGGLSERALTLEHVEANLLGGSVDGRAKLVFDPWHESTGEFSLHELHLAELKPWAQAGERISGAVSGEVTVEPSRSRRAPEPMKITARLSPVGARVLRLPVGETTLTAYAGRRRLLLDESRIQAAEGEVSLWVSLTRHAGDEWYTHVQSRLDALNLDVINQAFKEEPEPMPGRLSGRMSVVGPVGDWHAAVGQGNLELTESDLVNNPIIGSVYDALRLTAPSLDPTGKGSIRLRLDQGALHLSRISYFNHGIDFYGNLVVEDLAAGQNSALTGTVLGSVRPLKNLDLPGTGTFDRLLHSLQSAVSTFRVSGTLNEPKVTAASLDWAARTLRRLILNEREQQFESGATPVP